METGQRMVQRQQHAGGAVVVQRLEAIAQTKRTQLVAAAVVMAAAILFSAQPLYAQNAGEATTNTTAVESTSNTECPPGTTRTGVSRGIAGCEDANGTLVATQIAGQNTFQAVGSCNFLAFDFDQCIFVPLLTALGGTVMGLTGQLLTWASALFELLIQHAIINFGGAIKALGMNDTINQIWATSRDIANILIIGMFVFVAIATILGVQNYGWRKYIARILLVAIFINFSMFLTQFTIDASNFTAYQIYKAAPLLSSTSATASSDIATNQETTTVTTSGISGAFMDKIGISNAWGAYEELGKIGESRGSLSVIGYSLGASLLMAVVAALLFYGVFLIATRAILLVFLLLTSALAVGTALLPGNIRKRGWDAWLSSLINVAVFAPLIMLFLYATLLVLTFTNSEGSLSEYIRNPATGSEIWQVMFTFIIACGLLFVSFRLAGTFAKKIGGFDYAAAIPVLGGMAGARIAGWTGRNTIGRGAARLAAIQQERAQKLTTEGRHGAAAVSRITGQMASGVGKRSFNLMNTPAGKGFAGVAGGEKGLIGGLVKSSTAAGKGGFEAQEKETIKKQSGIAKYLAPTEEQQKKVLAEAQQNVEASLAAEKQKNAAAAQKVTDAESELAKLQKSQETLTRDISERQRQMGKASSPEQFDQLNEQQTRSGASLTTAKNRSAELEEFLKQARSEAAEASNVLETKRRETAARIIPKEALQSRGENVADIAHRRAANIPWRIVTGQTTEKDKVAQEVRRSVKKEADSKKEKERAQAYFGDAAPTPPAAPPAGTS